MATLLPSPVLARVTFESSGRIIVYWTPIPESSYFYTSVFLGNNPVTGASMISTGFVAMFTPNPPLSPGQVYTIKTAQCDQNGTLTSSFSFPMELIQNPVTSVQVYNNETNVQVSWQLPATGNATGAVVVLSAAGVSAPIYSQFVPGISVVIPLGIPLVQSASYSISTGSAASNGAAVGPLTTTRLILNKPVVAETTYSFQLNLLSVYASPPYPENQTLFGAVFAGKDQVSQVTSSGNISVQIPLNSSKLDYSKEYQVVTRFVNGGSYGPPGGAVDVAISLPILKSVLFDATSVKAEWENLPTQNIITGGKITLLGDGNPIAAASVRGYRGSVDIPAAPFNVYKVQISSIVGISTGPSCTPVTIPSVAPMISSIAYDGTNVEISWPAINNAPGFKAVIQDDLGGEVASSLTPGVNVAIQASLDPRKVYRAILCQYGYIGDAIVEGLRSVPKSMLSSPPNITSLSYGLINGKLTISMGWNAVSGANEYVINLYKGNAPVTVTPVITGTTATIVIDLEKWSNYFIVISGKNGTVTGPLCTPQALWVAPPEVTEVSYDGSNLYVSWNALAGYTDAFQVTLFKDGVALPLTDANRTGDLFLSLPVALISGSTYSVQVQTFNDLGSGPLSQALFVLHNLPVFSALSYDGKTISCSWSAVSDTGVTGYELGLFEGNYLIGSIRTSVPAGSLEAVLNESTTYTMKVRAIGSGLSGPWTNAQSMLSSSPNITNLSYGLINGKLTISMGWNAVSGANEYVINLYKGNAPVTVTPVVTGTTATIVIDLEKWSNYFIVISGKNGTVTGPLCTPQALWVAPPEVTEVSYDGSNLYVSWNALAGYTDAFQVTLFKDGVALPLTDANRTGDLFLSLPVALISGSTYSVQVQTFNDLGSGPLSQALFVLHNLPVFSVLSYDGKTISCSWSAVSDTGVTGYELGLFEGNYLIGSIRTSVAAGSLEAVLNESTTYTMKVRTIGLTLKGPWSTAETLISGSPVISQVTCAKNEEDISVKVEWGAFAPASTFAIILYDGNVQVPISPAPSYQGNAADFTMALHTTGAYRVMVSGINNKISGPCSSACVLIVAHPEISVAAYVKGNVQIGWGALSMETVSGYQALLFETGNTSPVETQKVTTNSAVIPFQLTEGKVYNVQVCALGSNTIGPLSKAVDTNVVSAAYFFSAFTADVSPYIYRSALRPPAQAAFDLYLPEIFQVPPSVIPPALNPGGPSPFKLSKVTDNNLPYKLTVATDSDAWNFQSGQAPIRPALATDYTNFLVALEAVDNGLLPGAIPFIRQVISRGLPLTLSETLYYAYGHNPASRYVDLQAGMRARIDYEMYQFVGPGTTQPLLNGFVGNSTVYYDMDEYLSGASQSSQIQQTGVNGFLSQLPLNVSPSNGGAGGLIDFYVSGFRQPYFRIFYPDSFGSADQPGWIGTSKNIAFVAADSYTDLENATRQFINGLPFPDSVKVGYFRGRAIIMPEIAVTLNAVSLFVPIGTTIRQLAIKQMALPLRPVVGGTTTFKTGNLQLLRSVENVINGLNEIAPVYQLNRRNEILFDYKQLITYTNGNDYYDIPLLNGDQITLLN